MVRRSVAVGFYPGSQSQLRTKLDSYFAKLGGLPKPSSAQSIGGLVPHAGYVFSGQTAACTFREIAMQLPETFVILGPNHRRMGSGVAVMTSGSWETPFGTLDIDEQFATDIYECCEILDEDALAHSQEHSIEVQLPFLQYIGGEKFVPISMAIQDAETSAEVGTAIAEASSGKKVGIIASSDLTHYGELYRFVPTPEDKALAWMEEVDGEILAGIEEMSLEKVYRGADNTTSCGHGCIAAMITACKNLGLEHAEILKYTTSYEYSQDTQQIVGYGAAVIK